MSASFATTASTPSVGSASWQEDLLMLDDQVQWGWATGLGVALGFGFMKPLVDVIRELGQQEDTTHSVKLRVVRPGRIARTVRFDNAQDAAKALAILQAPAPQANESIPIKLKVPDREQIVKLFRETSGGKFEVSNVEMLTTDHGGLLKMQTEIRVSVVENRRGEGTVFNPQLKDATKLRLKDQLLKWCRTKDLVEGDLSKVNLVPAWHGVNSAETARSIAKTGFAALGLTDPGYYGKGRYVTPESEYACMYSAEYPHTKKPNANGEWPVLFCVGAIGAAYPVTLCHDDFSQMPPTQAEHCKLYGMPIRSGYDAHVVAVKKPYFFAADPYKPDFHEIVFDQDAQLFPVAIVWFKQKHGQNCVVQ